MYSAFSPAMSRLTIGLPAFAIALAILVSPSAGRETGREALRWLALELVNQSRAAHNLPPLRLEAKLSSAAQFHADDMLRRDYYAHDSPEGRSVSDRYQSFGGSRWVLTAENIAKCEGCKPPLREAHVRQMHEKWMLSPGHRANILRQGLDRFGYGIVIDANERFYAVQTFAGPGTPEGGASAAGETALSPEEQAQAALEHINARRVAIGRKPLKLSAPLSAAARSLAPGPGASDFNVDPSPDLYGALPQAERKSWPSLTVLLASCGGCGATPMAADVANFTAQWLGHQDYEKILLSGDLTHWGFTIAADGQGKKIAVGLAGKRN
jgi:uncharacterized protein YkwD